MSNCYTPINICASRTTQLLANGQPDYAANGPVVTHIPVSVGVSPQVTEGALLEQLDGCGNICASLQQPDRLSNINLAMNLCKRDYGLLGMISNGPVFTSGSNAIGFALPDPELPILPVLFETWQIAQEGSAGTGQYIHSVFPFVTWSMGDSTMENGVRVETWNGKVSPNDIGFDAGGPFNDWPGQFEGPYMEFYDDALPAIVCGEQALAS